MCRKAWNVHHCCRVTAHSGRVATKSAVLKLQKFESAISAPWSSLKYRALLRSVMSCRIFFPCVAVMIPKHMQRTWTQGARPSKRGLHDQHQGACP